MELANIKYVYFIGIGGIGMSALARYFNSMGKIVGGYDKTETKLTKELIAEGISVHYRDDLSEIEHHFKNTEKEEIASILVVYTPAIPTNHSEFNFFKSNGFVLLKRAAVLGLICDASYTLAVAGTHGKTTTSSLVAHLLKTAGKDPSAFLGGITQNYNTNLLLSSGLKSTGLSKTTVVVEADEYDRSFLSLHPEMAIITSVDADHLDIYGDKKYVEESYNLFAKQVKGTLVLNYSIKEKVAAKQIITYALENKSADYAGMNLRIEDGCFHFDLNTPHGIINDLVLGLPGRHNVENAVAACAMLLEYGLAADAIRTGLKTFGGVRRRFDVQARTDKTIYIDDYAHHPEELKATIGSVKEMYPGKKITGVFQPHLFSRTRDFADAFAASLDMLDSCILLDIYPAREVPIEGVDAFLLLNKMKSENKKICSKATLIEEIKKQQPQVLLTMGAGDIDTLVEPIRISLLAL